MRQSVHVTKDGTIQAQALCRLLYGRLIGRLRMEVHFRTNTRPSLFTGAKPFAHRVSKGYHANLDLLEMAINIYIPFARCPDRYEG